MVQSRLGPDDNKRSCPLGSVVEHSLHTRGVTSSNLVAGTNIFNALRATPSRPFWPAHTFAHTLKSGSVIKSHKSNLFLIVTGNGRIVRQPVTDRVTNY